MKYKSTMSEYGTSEIFAKLGMLLQTFLVMKTIFATNFKKILSSHENDIFYDIVKRQVALLGDYRMTIEDAYCLFDKQYYKCRLCNAYLTNDRDPVICKTERHVVPFGLWNAVQTRFEWRCANCCPNVKRNIVEKFPIVENVWEKKIMEKLNEEDYHDFDDQDGDNDPV